MSIASDELTRRNNRKARSSGKHRETSTQERVKTIGVKGNVGKGQEGRGRGNKKIRAQGKGGRSGLRTTAVVLSISGKLPPSQHQLLKPLTHIKAIKIKNIAHLSLNMDDFM